MRTNRNEITLNNGAKQRKIPLGSLRVRNSTECTERSRACGRSPVGRQSRLQIATDFVLAMTALRSVFSSSFAFVFALFSFYTIPVSLSYGAFEELSAGARSQGMGNAFTAVADDINAVPYNPAGLGQVTESQLTAGYSRLALGLSDRSNISNSFYGFAQPIKSSRWGTAALTYQNLVLADHYKEDSFTLSYGRRLFHSIYGGIAIKRMSRSAESDPYTQRDPLFQRRGMSVTNYAADLGMLFRLSPHFVAGWSIKDLNEPNAGLESSDPLFRQIQLGLAYYRRSFIFAGDFLKRDRELGYNFGVEQWFAQRRFAVRGGLEAGSGNKTNITFGLGTHIRAFEFNYAFLFPMTGIQGISGNHRFSLTIRFGKPKVPERRLTKLDLQEFAQTFGPQAEEIFTLLGEIERLQKELEESNKLRSEMEDKLKQIQKELSEAIDQKAHLKEDESKVQEEKIKGLLSEIEELQKRMEDSTRKQTYSEKRLGDVQKQVELMKKALEEFRVETMNVPKGWRVYQAEKGDTLQSIAEKVLGDAGAWRKIYRLNQDRVRTGGIIEPGTILLIPPAVDRK